MAKIPDVTALGGRPTPSAPTSVASYRSSSGAEAAPALAIADAGNQMDAGGDQMWRLAKVEQEKNDVIRAEDAFSQLRKKALELTTAEGTGFVHQKGSNVATRPTLFKDYSALLKEAGDQIAATLDNEEQKQRFKQRYNVAEYQYQNDLLNHITKERGAYAEQVFKGTVETEIQEATTRWQDANAIALSLERMKAATNREADRVGAAPEARAATLQANESKVHAAVIAQALAAGDYAHANTWFEMHKDKVDKQTAVLVEKAVRDGEQKQIFNSYQRAFIDANNDPRSLAALEKSVADNPTLDETRKVALLGRIDSRREMIQRQQIAAQERQERALERAIGQVNTMTLQGFEPTTEQIAPLINAAAGTALEPQVNQMVAVANETRRFRGMPFIAQEAYLTQLEAAVRKDPTKFDVGMVQRFKTIHENQKKQATDNPVGFVIKQGFVNPEAPGAAPLDLSKPDKLDLASRFDLARTVSRSYGVPLKPLQPEEVALLQNAVRSMKPGEKGAYFGALAAQAGQDMAGYKAMMGQIAPDDPVTAAGGIAAMRGLTTTMGRTTADIIFRGQGYLNPPPKEDGSPVKSVVVMPPDKALNDAFNSYVGDAFDGKPGARNVFLQTARAIYAEKIVSGNNASGKGDQSGAINNGIWESAINLAVGGEPLKYRGRTVLPPPGVDAGAFKDGVAERIKAIETSGRLPEGVTARQLQGLPLENVGDGVYVFRSGDSKIVGADGKPIVIDFNPTPAGTIDRRRPIIENADGSFSTERTITIESDGKHLLIPTIVGGKALSEEQAIAAWRAGTNKAVGTYNSAEEAEAAAVKRSEEIGRVREGDRRKPIRNSARRTAEQVHQANIVELEREIQRQKDPKAKAILEAELAAERQLLARR